MDSRFKKLGKDPRFLKPKKDSAKIAIDSRFSHMLKSSEFGHKARVDKRGKIIESSAASDLKRFYKLEDNPSDVSEDSALSDPSLESDEDSSVADLDRVDYARGEGDVESSDDDPELDSDEEAALEEEAKGPWADEQVPMGDETSRLACVNLDWDHVKAKDLFKVFDGFKPARGFIKRVSVYPSEFGKKALAAEALHGPPTTVFKQSQPSDEAVSSLRPLTKREKKKERLKLEKLKERSSKPQAADADADEGKDFNTVALRKYQMDRLRYYYAVVECDSVACARAIFTACDGSEFESSGNFFDLRYIPEDMTFDDEPRDTAVELPGAYQPKEFVTQALQHSSVKLTWDNDDPERQKTTRRRFNKQDLKDMDFKAYLASSDSEEDLHGVDEALKEKYRALVAGSGGEESEGEDMEITFAPGLSEKAAKRLEEKKERELQKEETVFETQLRKQKEKKKAKKMSKADQALESESEERDDIDDDPFFQTSFGSDYEDSGKKDRAEAPKKKSTKLTKEERIEKQRSRAELELLLVDDNNQTQNAHFSAKDIIKAEKSKSKKQKKKLQKASLDLQDDFQMDLNDPRFSSLIDDHQFFIDPTNSQYADDADARFKNTATMKKILSKKREQREQQTAPAPHESQPAISSRTVLNSLVESVKRKTVMVQGGKGKRSKV
ncbi:pre-rRNA-processing protein esf1 [Kappamyces sp. JEL0680]|nr:pre-rRNA-processing protein esf1 [Kappamyces sp. JEL0680]